MKVATAFVVAAILVVAISVGVEGARCRDYRSKYWCNRDNDCEWKNNKCQDKDRGPRCDDANSCQECDNMQGCAWDKWKRKCERGNNGDQCGPNCHSINDCRDCESAGCDWTHSGCKFDSKNIKACGPDCDAETTCDGCNAVTGCGWSGSTCSAGATPGPCCGSRTTCDDCADENGCSWVQTSTGSTACFLDADALAEASKGGTVFDTCTPAEVCEAQNSCYDCTDADCYWVDDGKGFPVCSAFNEGSLLSDGGCTAFCEDAANADCATCSGNGCEWGGSGCSAGSVPVTPTCPVCEHYESCTRCSKDPACNWGAHSNTGATGCHDATYVPNADSCACEFGSCDECQSNGCFWVEPEFAVEGQRPSCASTDNENVCVDGCVDGDVLVGPFGADGSLQASGEPIGMVSASQSFAQRYRIFDNYLKAVTIAIVEGDMAAVQSSVSVQIHWSGNGGVIGSNTNAPVVATDCLPEACTFTFPKPLPYSDFWVMVSTNDPSVNVNVLGVPDGAGGVYVAGQVTAGVATIPSGQAAIDYSPGRAGVLAAWGLVVEPACCVEECLNCHVQKSCGDCSAVEGCTWWYTPNGGMCFDAYADPVADSAGDVDDTHPDYFEPFTTSSCCFDADGDGIPTCPDNTVCTPSCPADLSIDCDDSAESGFGVNPFAAEVSCDSVDNDCDSETPDHLVEITFDGEGVFNEPTSDGGEVACANFRVKLGDGCVSSANIRVDLEVSPSSSGDTAVAGFHYVDDDDLHVVFVSRNSDVRAGVACVALVNNDVDEVVDETTLTVRIAAAYTIDSNGIRNDLHPVGIATGKRQITASIVDTDQAEWIVGSPSRVFVDEDGSAATVTVRPATQPIESVAMATGSSNTAEGVVAPSMVTFTAQDWTTAKTITISGVDDGEDDGAETFELLLFSVNAASADDSLYGEGVFDEKICFTNEGLGGDSSLIPVLEIVDIQALSAKLEWTTIPSAESYLVVANYEGGRARLYQAPAKEGTNPLYQSLQVSIPQQSHVLFSVQPIFPDGSLGTLSIGRDTALAKSGGRAVDGALFENGDSSLTFGSSSPSTADGSPVYGACAPVQEANEGSLSCVVVGNLSPNLDVGGSKRSWLTREVDGVRWWSVSVVDGVSEALYILIIDDFDPDECPSASFTVSATGNVREVIITGTTTEG